MESFVNILDYLWNLFESILHPVAVFFTSHAGIFVVCLGILVWACCAAVTFRRRVRPVEAELIQAIKELKKGGEFEEFISSYHEFNEFCLSLPVLANSWREFTEVLLFPGTDLEEDDVATICNTQQPGLFFSPKTILWPHVSMRFYNALPNLLTGTGILGTFIGLVAGISLAAPGLDSNNIQDAKNALEILLSGASLAFLTSIFGLSSSIAFSWFEKKQVHEIDKYLSSFIELLEEKVEYLGIEKISSKALLQTRKQTASLESFSNDLAITLGDQIESRMTNPMNATLESLGDIMKEQQVILQGIREDQEKANDETLHEIVDKFSESISGAAGKEMKSLANTISSLSENLEGQITTMAENHAVMQKESQNNISKLQQSFEQNTEQLQNQVTDAVNKMVSGVSTTVYEMTKMLEEASSKSAKNLKDISNQLYDSIVVLQDTVHDMSEVNKGTNEIMSKVEKLLGTVNHFQDELIKATEPIEKAANGIQETSNSIQESTKMMTDASTTLKNSVDQIENAQNDLAESWKSYEQRFEKVDDSLAKVFYEIEQGLATYASSTRNYIEELDRHASKVVTHLSGAVTDMNGEIENLSEVLELMSNNVPSNLNEKKQEETIEE